MSAEVRSLREGLAPPVGERLPNESVLKLCREALDKAESGELQAVAIVMVDRDGFGMNLFHAAGRDYKVKLAAHISRLFYQWMKAWEES